MNENSVCVCVDVTYIGIKIIKSEIIESSVAVEVTIRVIKSQPS